MLKLYSIAILVFSLCSTAFPEEKLIFAIDIIRHGDRTPLIASPEMAKIWPQGPGQLTPKGMRQEFLLGKSLRERYIKQYHLLPEQYDVNTMMVRSSGYPRTLMSTQSFLYGLYPLGTGPATIDALKALPKGFQPIPIFTLPPERDSLLVPNYDKKKYRELLETYIFNSPEWIEKESTLKPHFARWSKILDVPIAHLFDLIHAGDRLFVERLYNIPPPNDLDEKEADIIIRERGWVLLYIINQPKLAAIAGKKLAEKIKQELNKAAEQNRPLKYILFVAHETTIAAQLKILGQTIENIPPYASILNYSLFDRGASNYEVRISLNAKPIMINFCQNKTCTLDELTNFLDKRIE